MNSILRPMTSALWLALAGLSLTSTPVSAESLHVATRSGDLVAVQGYVDGGADLNARNDYGSTPLTIAVTYGQTGTVGLLIENGADLNLEGSGGSTPLHLATFFGRAEQVKLLLGAGANAAKTNAAGSTALDVAKAPFDDDLPVYEAMARALKKRGLELDLARIKADRAKIAGVLAAHQQ